MRPELQDIVDEVSRLLLTPVTLEDHDFNVVAFGSHGGRIDEVRRQSILQRRCSREVTSWLKQFGIAATDQPVRTPASPELGVLARLCIPARWDGVTYGYLWLLDEHDAIDGTKVPTALAHARRAARMLAQQARARGNAGLKLWDLLTADLETAEHAAQEICELSAIGRGNPVAVVELRSLARAGDLQPVNLWNLPRSVLAAPGEDRTTLLVPLDTNDVGSALGVAHQALKLYAEQHDPEPGPGLVAGVGAPRTDLALARGSWREARLAAKISQAAPAFRPVASWPALGVLRLLACGSGTELAAATLDSAVMQLVDHDDARLRDTANVYFQHGGNIQQTASSLNVHRQTVYYRLQRIETVTGLDLSRGDHRLQLHLGLLMAPFLAEMNGGLIPSSP